MVEATEPKRTCRKSTAPSAPKLFKAASAPSTARNTMFQPIPPESAIASLAGITVADLRQVLLQYVYLVSKDGKKGKLSVSDGIKMDVEEEAKVSRADLEQLVRELQESNRKWEEREGKWEKSYQELQDSHRQLKETVVWMEELNTKVCESHVKVEKAMKEISDQFHNIQNSVEVMVSSQNSHMATLESHHQALQEMQ
jgi:hypothetical protein